jgi:hypothetical protein
MLRYEVEILWLSLLRMSYCCWGVSLLALVGSSSDSWFAESESLLFGWSSGGFGPWLLVCLLLAGIL